MTINQRFDQFLENIKLTSDQASDGAIKHAGVRSCLNKNYFNSDSTTAHSFLVGSWGKSTRVRPPRDIDVMFVLPESVYQRFQLRTGNKQSQLLQEVKAVLERTYTSTKMRADGQIVLVPFLSYAVEVVPSFELQNGRYWICDTNDGGKYKTVDPTAEANSISSSDTASSGKTRHLIKMMKKWQDYCSVPMKSFWIELLATDFMSSWEYKDKTMFYYDYMVRDFLAYVITKANTHLIVPGSYEFVWLGEDWKSRTETAHGRAVKACEYEANNTPIDSIYAGMEWQKIFGADIPTS